LYEIYKWERNNLDKDLKGKQTVWLKEALQKRLPVKRPIENLKKKTKKKGGLTFIKFGLILN
jgi:hypothetical protein